LSGLPGLSGPPDDSRGPEAAPAEGPSSAPVGPLRRGGVLSVPVINSLSDAPKLLYRLHNFALLNTFQRAVILREPIG